MSIYFDADEIFSVAVKIEENGERFYRRAAEMLLDPDVSRLLITLAEKEVEHKAIFSKLRKTQLESGEKIAVDPDTENEAYLKAWADGHVFNIANDPLDMLTGDESVEKILQIGIGAEKDSIVFYLGMKDAVYGDRDKAVLDRIIKEEMGHYAMLSLQLDKVRGKVN